jgi:RNA polymerase sigma-70 factor (ECF subfamily)
MESKTDIERKVATGDSAAFSLLFSMQEGALFRLAHRMTGNSEEAAEICQETFARALESIRRYDPERSFFTWLYTICLNLIRDHLRKRRRFSLLFPFPFRRIKESTPDPAQDPEKQIIRLESERLVQRGLNAIAPKLREAVLLRFMENLSFAEIGEVLGISTSAAKMRVYRGLEKLREIVNEEPFGFDS